MENPTNWIGLICNTNTKQKVDFNKATPYWIMRVITMERTLKEHNFKVFCYSPCDVDLESLHAVGYYLMDDKFIQIKLSVPDVNYDYYFGRSPSESKSAPSLSQFVRTATKHFLQVYNLRGISKLAKDKYTSYMLIRELDETLVPNTIKLARNDPQIEEMLNSYPIVFLKPQYGSMGNGIVVLKKKGNKFHTAFYKNMKITKKSLLNISEASKYALSLTGKEDYIIQQGIEGHSFNNSAFDIRATMVNDNRQWHAIHLVRLGASGSNLSNLSQGGSVWETHEVLEQIYSKEKTKHIIENIEEKSVQVAKCLNQKYDHTIIEISCDFILDKEGNIYIAEINTKPGLSGIPEFYVDGYLNMTQKEQHLFDNYALPHGEILARFLLSKSNESNSVKHSVWFDQLNEIRLISEVNSKHLADAIFDALQQRSTTLNQLPSEFAADVSPQIIFLSLSDTKTRARVFIGSGLGCIEAVQEALKQIYDDIEPHFQLKWLKLDIVQSVQSFEQHKVDTPLVNDRSLHGLAFDHSIGLAFLPEELIAMTLVNNDQLIQRNKINKYILTPQRRKLQGKLDYQTIYQFRLNSLFKTQTESYPLYRGHRLYSQLHADDLLSRCELAGKYLRESVNPQGEFLYEYLSKQDKSSGRYNMLRHCGSIYSMLELYHINKDGQLLKTAERAIQYLLERTHTKKSGANTVRFLVENGVTKLGGNALAILALCEYFLTTGNLSYLLQTQELANWIKQIQNSSGNFTIHKQRVSSGKVSSFASGYYPGEAIFALCRLNQCDKQPQWIDIAEKAADYLINIRDKKLSLDNLAHDHWLLYGLNQLYRARPNRIYIDHSIRITTAIIRDQYRKKEPPDYLGSYYDDHRSSPTAIRAEGLIATYQLISDFDRKTNTKELLEAIKKCIRFQLQTQYQPETVMYLPNPQYAFGGFHKSLTDHSIRIDNVQHNLSAILGLCRLLAGTI